MITTTEAPATETKPEPRKRHEYNKYNPDKNLFLQFLNDEIPLVGHDELEGTIYFSDFNMYELNDDEERFYIVDMNGDGNPEFGYIHVGMLYMLRYNEEKDCFELWLAETQRQRPLGNGKMYYQGGGSYNATSYSVSLASVKMNF